MPVIKCLCAECKHNDNNICTAKSIILGYSYITTMYDGQNNMWICNQYKLSEFAQKVYAEYVEFLNKINGGENNE